MRYSKKYNKKHKKDKKNGKKHTRKNLKKFFSMKGGNGIMVNSPLAPSEILTLDKVPGPFIGSAYNGGLDNTWPGVTASSTGATESNYYALNKGYNTEADPVGYLNQTNLGGQKGGMFRNSMKRVMTQNNSGLRRLGSQMIKQGKELSKEIGKDLSEKSFKKSLKGSPITPMMKKISNLSLNPNNLEDVRSKLFGGKKNKTKKHQRKHKGGGLIPQDIVNLGRSITTGLGNIYNSVNGDNLTASPLPYKDQPISQNNPILTNMPPNYGSIYNASNLEVGSIN